jgi:hypothetical protein
MGVNLLKDLVDVRAVGFLEYVACSEVVRRPVGGISASVNVLENFVDVRAVGYTNGATVKVGGAEDGGNEGIMRCLRVYSKFRSRSTPHWRLRPNKTTNKLACDTMIYMNHDLEGEGRQTLENGMFDE